MKMQTTWIDRAQSHEALEHPDHDMVRVFAVTRTGSVALAAPLASFWAVVRGGGELQSREGRFHLQAGDWIVLEPDSHPSVYASRDSLVLGVAMSAQMRTRARQFTHLDLHTGRGQLARGERRQCLRLWRTCGLFARSGRTVDAEDAASLVPLLRQVWNLQYDFPRLIGHCPGRSLRRKRQVFERMQRARLYLEGHVERNVRLAELAGLSSVSTWYFTKVFHALYGEGPQAMAARLRLGRATRLLSHTGLSVGEVGAVCGFENNCSFSRAFRERYGVPPSRYRDSVEPSRLAAHGHATADPGHAAAVLRSVALR